MIFIISKENIHMNYLKLTLYLIVSSFASPAHSSETTMHPQERSRRILPSAKDIKSYAYQHPLTIIAYACLIKCAADLTYSLLGKKGHQDTQSTHTHSIKKEVRSNVKKITTAYVKRLDGLIIHYPINHHKGLLRLSPPSPQQEPSQVTNCRPVVFDTTSNRFGLLNIDLPPKIAMGVTQDHYESPHIETHYDCATLCFLEIQDNLPRQRTITGQDQLNQLYIIKETYNQSNRVVNHSRFGIGHIIAKTMSNVKEDIPPFYIIDFSIHGKKMISPDDKDLLYETLSNN